MEKSCTWESDDPKYWWVITADQRSKRLDIHTDDAPDAAGARAFAAALALAADWLDAALAR